MGTSIRVLLADDHPIVQTGIGDVCGYGGDVALVGVAQDSRQTQTMLLQLQPDVLLLDLNMPGDDACETIYFTHRHCPHTHILIFSAYCEPAQIQELVSCGINGYVLKTEAPDALLAAIRTAAQGGHWFSESVFVVLGFQREITPANQLLTSRESEILDLIGQGYDNQQIAEELHMAKQTVANHVSRIYEKLGFQSRAEAILWQVENRSGE